MATYQNLPVFRASYDFLTDFYIFSKNLPKEYKYTVGEKIKGEALELILKIHKANASTEKRKQVIEEAIEHVERVRILLRLLKDTQKIGLEKFVELSEKIESVNRQLSGWRGVS